MKGGRNIKPVAKKKAEGTYRKDRDKDRLELSMPAFVGELMPPPHFDKRHVVKFKECQRLLSDAGILQPQDFDSIVTYVENQILAADAWESLQKDGMTVIVTKMDKDGNIVSTRPMTNPAFRQYQDCQKILKPLMEQFAFTPKARMSIKVQREKPKAESAILKAMSRSKTA